MQVIMDSPAVKRKTRSPRHNWYLHARPWQIQPFLIAPVLPGETLKNLSMQARTVTDPIRNPLMGWWLEHYVFFVKLRDLYARDLLTAMVLKPETDLSTLDAATDVKYYHQNGAGLAINWPKMCVETIVDNYFRFEGEVSADYTLNGLPTAGVSIENGLDSLIAASKIETSTAGFDQDLTSVTAGQGDATAKVLTSEIEKSLKEYEYARLMKTTDMTFEDWCATFGVVMPKEELFRPELIRYSREWQYPSNTIDPTSGAPSSAVSWSSAVRADKDRYFKEPGFIVGVVVCRPKVYFKNLRSHMTMLMRTALGWLPPSLASDPMASYTKVASGDAPVVGASTDYYVDIKDTFIYGDQFTNLDISAEAGANFNVVTLPKADLTNLRYAASTDADNLFVDTTAGVGKYRTDGVCELQILGRQVDTSPSMVGTNKTV